MREVREVFIQPEAMTPAELALNVAQPEQGRLRVSDDLNPTLGGGEGQSD